MENKTKEEKEGVKDDENYRIPEWITEEMKKNFWEMWHYFHRTSKDYYENKLTLLNGKHCKGEELTGDKELSGIYYHKWNNIGWLLLPNGEVKHICNAEETPTPNDWISEKMKEFDKEFCYKDSRDGKMKLTGSVYFADNFKAFIRQSLTQQKEAIEKEWRENRKELLEYINHKPDCILSQFEAGEPDNKGGYRQKFAGKWYDKTPKCDCGLDKLLKD